MATYTDNYALTKPTMSELADIRVINSNMDAVDEIMHGSQVSIADAYDPTLTYDVDDLVMNDFLLYKCVTAVTTPEAFDPTKWERTTAAAEGSGGGGSSVIANPVGTPTDDLDTVEIDGVIYNIVGGGGYISIPEIYSTTEKQVGVWTDGKPIYQKSFLKTASDFSGTTSTTDLTSLNVDTFIDAKGMFTSGTGAGEFIAPLPYVESLNVSTSSINMFFLTQSKEFCVRKSNANYDVSSFFFTIWYTKTTDTPGSGSWTPSGTEAVHYSTNEQVIGTWIDGSTIYERTYDNLSVQTDGTNWVTISAIDVTNIDQIINAKALRIQTVSGKLINMPLGECAVLDGALKISMISATFNDVIRIMVLQYTKTSS